MAEKDYYKILELSPDASEADIKKAFRRLAKKYHPDTNGGDAEAARRFQEINEAHAVLSDEGKRKAYDEARLHGAAGGKDTTAGTGKQKRQGQNPFAGFDGKNFKMDFGDMMFDELNKGSREKKSSQNPMDFTDVSSQFASFFGFKPK